IRDFHVTGVQTCALPISTIEQQIERLESRGMTIPDYEKAKEHLLDIGYYRLGFYWYYFEKDKEHNFFDYTNLDDVIDLYYLDIRSEERRVGKDCRMRRYV